jgi:hypothetical protein
MSVVVELRLKILSLESNSDNDHSLMVIIYLAIFFIINECRDESTGRKYKYISKKLKYTILGL